MARRTWLLVARPDRAQALVERRISTRKPPRLHALRGPRRASAFPASTPAEDACLVTRQPVASIVAATSASSVSSRPGSSRSKGRRGSRTSPPRRSKGSAVLISAAKASAAATLVALASIPASPPSRSGMTPRHAKACRRITSSTWFV